MFLRKVFLIFFTLSLLLSFFLLVQKSEALRQLYADYYRAPNNFLSEYDELNIPQLYRYNSEEKKDASMRVGELKREEDKHLFFNELQYDGDTIFAVKQKDKSKEEKNAIHEKLEKLESVKYDLKKEGVEKEESIAADEEGKEANKARRKTEDNLVVADVDENKRRLNEKRDDSLHKMSQLLSLSQPRRELLLQRIKNLKSVPKVVAAASEAGDAAPHIIIFNQVSPQPMFHSNMISESSRLAVDNAQLSRNAESNSFASSSVESYDTKKSSEMLSSAKKPHLESFPNGGYIIEQHQQHRNNNVDVIKNNLENQWKPQAVPRSADSESINNSSGKSLSLQGMNKDKHSFVDNGINIILKAPSSSSSSFSSRPHFPPQLHEEKTENLASFVSGFQPQSFPINNEHLLPSFSFPSSSATSLYLTPLITKRTVEIPTSTPQITFSTDSKPFSFASSSSTTIENKSIIPVMNRSKYSLLVNKLKENLVENDNILFSSYTENEDLSRNENLNSLISEEYSMPKERIFILSENSKSTPIYDDNNIYHNLKSFSIRRLSEKNNSFDSKTPSVATPDSKAFNDAEEASLGSSSSSPLLSSFPNSQTKKNAEKFNTTNSKGELENNQTSLSLRTSLNYNTSDLISGEAKMNEATEDKLGRRSSSVAKNCSESHNFLCQNLNSNKFEDSDHDNNNNVNNHLEQKSESAVTSSAAHSLQSKKKSNSPGGLTFGKNATTTSFSLEEETNRLTKYNNSEQLRDPALPLLLLRRSEESSRSAKSNALKEPNPLLISSLSIDSSPEKAFFSIHASTYPSHSARKRFSGNTATIFDHDSVMTSDNEQEEQEREPEEEEQEREPEEEEQEREQEREQEEEEETNKIQYEDSWILDENLVSNHNKNAFHKTVIPTKPPYAQHTSPSFPRISDLGRKSHWRPQSHFSANSFYSNIRHPAPSPVYSPNEYNIVSKDHTQYIRPSLLFPNSNHYFLSENHYDLNDYVAVDEKSQKNQNTRGKFRRGSEVKPKSFRKLRANRSALS